MSAPVTPCAPAAVAAFVEQAYGPEVAKMFDSSERFAAGRQRRITELRRLGELRAAERFGWLTLAGWLLGMRQRQLDAIDPSSKSLGTPAGPRDIVGAALGADGPPELRPVGTTGLEASDPRDAFGLRFLELTVAAVSGPEVVIDDRIVDSPAFAASLKARLEVTTGG